MLITTDNNCGNCDISEHDLDNFQKIANTKIKDINIGNNSNLLIFPNSLNDCKDKIYDESIFSLQEKTLTTGNIMGFVGINDSELSIKSRFTEEKNDYFLHYMLEKVFSLNLFNLEHSTAKESIFDFLIYLFPFFLKRALSQGLFKEYKKNSYNNANIRGNIDISTHIRKNIPFNGKISYQVREHSHDNKITQLIRHTIEFIKKHKSAYNILFNDYETNSEVNKIIQATPSYDHNSKKSIINMNLRPLNHPYFLEYQNLQKICLLILRYEGLKYGEEKDKVYGLLFDGAWLWEEYLNTILKDCNFFHPNNKNSKGAIYLFEEPKSYKRYPDFWKNNFIIDAKYKKLTNKKIDRNDMNQIISYMYIKKAHLGGFIYPSDKAIEENIAEEKIGKLNGYNGIIKKWKLSIPQQSKNYQDFCNKIHKTESKLKTIIQKNDNETSQH